MMFWRARCCHTASRQLEYVRPAARRGAPDIWEFVVALVLALGVSLAWLVPHERAALVFTRGGDRVPFPRADPAADADPLQARALADGGAVHRAFS